MILTTEIKEQLQDLLQAAYDAMQRHGADSTIAARHVYAVLANLFDEIDKDDIDAHFAEVEAERRAELANLALEQAADKAPVPDIPF